MGKLKINIVGCPANSYKLTGIDINHYYEEALQDTNETYLSLHDEMYRKLMFKDFNPLWTPDTISTNDVDSKDGFWSMHYCLFNIHLIKILSDNHDIKVIDKTGAEFPNEQYLFKYIKHRGIDFEPNERKQENRLSKQYIKKLIKKSIKNRLNSIQNSIQFFKKEYIKRDGLSKKSLRKESDKNSVYLYVPPVGNMTLNSYLNWRFRELFKHYEKQGKKIFLVATKDFDDSDDIEYPFINVNRFISRKDLLEITLKSILFKLKVNKTVRKNLKVPGSSPEKEFFLKNIPARLFYAVKENYGFNNLFRELGPGLLIIKGPIISKGASMQIFNARKYGVRVLTIAGRILTSTRLSNCFSEVHSDSRFPNVLPHSMVVSDRISCETIQKQNENIEMYHLHRMVEPPDEKGDKHHPFSITLALQKRNEMEGTVDEVISAIQHMDSIVLNLKPHPNFAIPRSLIDKYSKLPFVNILDTDISLRDAVKISDLCITAYSSSALEFAQNSKPIVWLKYVTLNSIFFTDLFKRIGEVANNAHELENIIRLMKDDSDYYIKQKKEQYAQFKSLIYESSQGTESSFNSIIERELENI